MSTQTISYTEINTPDLTISASYVGDFTVTVGEDGTESVAFNGGPITKIYSAKANRGFAADRNGLKTLVGRASGRYYILIDGPRSRPVSAVDREWTDRGVLSFGPPAIAVGSTIREARDAAIAAAEFIDVNATSLMCAVERAFRAAGFLANGAFFP